MDSEFAKRLLRQTAETYDNIAQSFSQTRGYVPGRIESKLTEFIKTGDKVLDIGCGNGRFCGLFQKIGVDYTGIDNSKELVRIARDRYAGLRFEAGDATDLPFPAETFDVAVAVAVLHHIPSNNLRIKSFYETHRVLKAGGIFIVTAWDLRPVHMVAAGEWKRFRSYIKEQLAIVSGLSKLDLGDFFIPWQNRYRRYVRALTLGQMRGLAADVGFTIVEAGVLRLETSKEQNLYIVCRKA